MQNRLTRWALAIIMVSLAALLGLSTLLNVGHPLLVGSSDRAPSTAAAADRPVDGSIPGRGQPGVLSESPLAVVMIDTRLSDPSVDSLLAALESSNDKATFFVVGTDIPGNEGVLRRILEAGHEVGLGSFNRSRIGDLSPSNQLDQYQLAQRYVEGATGRSPKLVRLPYSSDAKSLSEADVKAAQNLHASGFTTVFADVVLNDAAELPELDGESRLILVDEQSETEAFVKLLTALQQERYDLSTVSDYGGIEGSEEVGFFRQAQSRTLLWGTAFQQHLWAALAAVLIALSLFLTLRYLLALALIAGRRRLTRSTPEFGSAGMPAVSVLIPARNADRNLKRTLASIQQSDYAGTIEILVIDDGSSDKTASIARQTARVRVLSQTHSGRASAVNEGIRSASHDVCVLTYADAEFRPDTLLRLVAPLSNPTVALVTGYAINQGKSWLRNVAAIERVSRFHINQRMEIMLGLGTEMSGAISAIRRSAVVDIGGVANVTSAANMDLTVSLGIRGWDLAFEPNAPVKVTGETNLHSLWRHLLDQRYGMLQVMWKHRKRHPGGNNSRYRLPALLYRLLTDFVIPLVTPLIDVFVLASSLSGKRYLLASIWYAAIVVQLFATWVAVLISKVKDLTVVYSIPHFLLFRYLNFFVAARALFLVADGRQAGHEETQSTKTGIGPALADEAIFPGPSVAKG